AAADRVALLIGNGEYRYSPLKNPINDARLMKTSLEQVGFEVRLLENASAKEMVRAIRDFGDQLAQSKTGLFYYSGHAVQYDNSNFLIPVSVGDLDEASIEYDTVDVNRVLKTMEVAGSPTNIVILDAC